MKSISEINKIHKNFLNLEIFFICLGTKTKKELFCFDWILFLFLLHFLYIKYREKDKDNPNE